MSYSFSVKADTKEAAKVAVSDAFDKVVESQPIHARDKAAALTNAAAVIDLLTDPAPEGSAINVSCSGYVNWMEVLREDGSNPLTTASVSASASYVSP
jgi:hypothetical protein